jgi:DNA helicase-2/ATP-dependent DNA helicase PcrA
VAWELLKRIIGERTQILFLGDPLQRIYGFIGAVPEIMEIARVDLQAEKIVLEKNYRFKDNYEMLKLDRNIRLNATNNFDPIIPENALLETFWADNQSEEAKKVISKIVELQEAGINDKVAILFRGRGGNSEIFEQELANCNMDYFYGMFTDDDQEYIDFHRYCQNEFIKRFGKNASIGKKSLTNFSKKIAENYSGTNAKMKDSLCILLDAFVKKMINDYSDLSAEDKYSLALDIFENRQLKQAMEYVDAKLILSTIHGAKGLEWSYVFLADLERWGLPSYFTCKDCVNKFTKPIKAACPLPSAEAMNIESMLDELSVLYVAVTRAKKQVYVSASAKRAAGKEGCLSCMSHLPGISIVNAE